MEEVEGLDETINSIESKEKLLSQYKKNIIRYRNIFKGLLSPNDENIYSNHRNFNKLFSLCKKIFSSDAIAKAFLYLCLHGAATAWILQVKINLTEPTAYRALKKLRTLNIVKPAVKIPKKINSKGGPRPTVWAIEGATTEEISKTLNLHIKTLSPKYRIAEEVAQTILDNYLSKKPTLEITYREIVLQIKQLMIPFNTPDIADLTAKYLHERGIRIWR